MKYIRCVRCKGSTRKTRHSLQCIQCRYEYPIVRGIPRMLKKPKDIIEKVRTSFDLQWKNADKDFEYSHFNEEFEKRLPTYFCWDAMMDPAWFEGKSVLDAGCGTGRWSYALARLGAKVTAMDYNDVSVEVTRKSTRHFPNVTVVQADLREPPFAPESFDYVLSWGVLHHTADTYDSFKRMVPLVKFGGMMHIMVYEKHNPLKITLTELVGAAMRNFSDKTVYAFSKMLAWIGKYRVARYALKPFLELGPSVEGVYDTYSTPINHHHSASEVYSWLAENGFGDIHINASRKRKGLEAFFRGPYGGNITMRGRRGTHDGKPAKEVTHGDWLDDFNKVLGYR